MDDFRRLQVDILDPGSATLIIISWRHRRDGHISGFNLLPHPFSIVILCSCYSWSFSGTAECFTGMANGDGGNKHGTQL